MADAWQGSPQAYLGTSVAGYPNLFFVTGPNTGLGHNSLLFMIEAQLAFVMDAIFPLAPFVGSDLERGLPPASERCDIRCHNAVRLLEPVPPRQRCVEFSSGLPIQLISGIAGTIQPSPAMT